MTFRRVALALLFCGCADAPATVTVATPPPRTPTATVVNVEPDFGCAAYAKAGPRESASAFRACVEKVVAAETPCEGGASPDLPTLELAAALIDGAGGPADAARARKLLAGCFRDASVQDVIAHADEKESNATTPPFASCEDFAMTTFAISECFMMEVQVEQAWMRRLRGEQRAEVLALFDAAASAANAYARALGLIQYARYADGTIRDVVAVVATRAEMQTRRARIAAISAWRPRVPALDRETARTNLARTFKTFSKNQPDVATAIRAEERAWRAYRDAEASLYEKLHPGARDAIFAELAVEHADAVGAMVEDR
jgi:hypothetical protein